jgi:hypothetical protein
MRLTRQARIFAKQVQVDLLALSDCDLFQIVHLWISREPLASSSQAQAAARSALGYTPGSGECLTFLKNNGAEYEERANTHWFAPAPHHLRNLLEQMNLQSFVAIVLPLAFNALHSLHPEWGEEGTFHAHLADYLRRVRKKQYV